jgi:hypothetical protein
MVGIWRRRSLRRKSVLISWPCNLESSSSKGKSCEEAFGNQNGYDREETYFPRKPSGRYFGLPMKES